MGEDWSHEEVEATVADYFNMLNKELRGQDYNKTVHRRQLSVLLNNRSDGAIERKHQNISAVLRDLNFPFINGYKPLGNYQRKLFNVVTDRLENNHTLVSYIKQEVEAPVKALDFDDILKRLVESPAMEKSGSRASSTNEFVREFRTGLDYLAQEAKNHSLGLAGEEFVIKFEQARLVKARQERLASKIEHISRSKGDSAGYDILSFEESGQERLIEVKTTAYGSLTPFYVTRNEVELSANADHGYYLYRTFNFRRDPKLFTRNGSLIKTFKLEPLEYLARVG
ncbi:MAG TPA: DUF3883 domain-containing protein [Candidatus Limnocylindrales bacterium]|nr:DUF3883 domain-containing protein [Candidatus Limnocylindrales bacterium]